MYSFQLPSGIEAEIKEMTGAEEDILTNQRQVRTGNAVNLVLRNCLVRLGEKESPSVQDVLDLLSGDRLTLLVEIRRLSLGDDVALSLVCPSPACRTTNLFSVDLSELETKPYGDQREFTFALPGSKKTVVYGLMDGHMEKRLATLKEPTMASAMTMRISEIAGQKPTKKLMNDMSLRDRNALRNAMQEVDGGVDTLIEISCDGCGQPLRTRLESEANFLFPGAPS